MSLRLLCDVNSQTTDTPLYRRLYFSLSIFNSNEHTHRHLNNSQSVNTPSLRLHGSLDIRASNVMYFRPLVPFAGRDLGLECVEGR